jgi:P pilus assembly chaperone PapD
VRPARCLAVAASAAVGVAMPRAAAAQLAVDHVELTLRPDVKDQRVALINVRNEGATTVQATIRLEDWNRAEDGTNNFSPLRTLPGSCAAVLNVFPLAASLAPGATQSIRVTLDSAAAPTRECWSAAVVETVEPRTNAGRTVAYVLRTAVKIYVEPAGLPSDAIVADMKIAPRPAPAAQDGAARSEAAAQLDVLFQNTGERHVVARGSVEFRRADNSVAAKVELPDVYALPGAKSRVTAPLPALPAGRYVVLAMFDFGGDDIVAAQTEYEAR